MNIIKEQYHSIFNTKIDGIGLAVFRIAFALVLLAETCQLFRFRHIVYDKDPFVYIGEIDVAYIFYFWFIVIGFLIFGFCTRMATILNYVFSVIIFSSADRFEYHVFYAYVAISFMLMFMPVARVFSIDSLIRKIKYTGIGKPYRPDRKVLEINYLMPVFAILALVYIDSIFFKLTSKMWMDGLGVWLPSSLPMLTWTNTSFLLNNEILIKFLGYLVLVFETVFIFLFWFRKWRVPLLLIGIFFHLGILIAYPIPWFALIAVVTYLLMIPTSFWLGISSMLKFKKPIFSFYYDAECPLCAKVIVVIRHIDIFKTINCATVQGNYLNDAALKSFDEETLLINIYGVTKTGKVSVGYWAYVQLFKSMIYLYPIGLILSIPGISHIGKQIYAYIAGDRLTTRCTEENCSLPLYHYPTPETQDILVKGWNRLAITKTFWKFLFIFFIVAQCLVIWTKPIMKNIVPRWDALDKVIGAPYRHTQWFLTKYLGITTHPVFMYDRHFKGYNHIFKVTYESGSKSGLVPVSDENGMMTNSYMTGAFWVNYDFRINSKTFDVKQFETGMVPFLKYFENETHSKGNTFTFYVKEIENEEVWKSDFLNSQIKKPWIKAGTCTIINGTAYYEWNEKMHEIIRSEANEK